MNSQCSRVLTALAARSLCKSIFTWAVMIMALIGGSSTPAWSSSLSFEIDYTGNGKATVIDLLATDNGNGTYTATSITSGTRATKSGTMTLMAPGQNFGNGNGSTNYISNNIFVFSTSNPTATNFTGIGYQIGNEAWLISYNGSNIVELGCGSVSNGCTNAAQNSVSGFTMSEAPSPIPGAGLLSYLVVGFGGLAACRKKVLAQTTSWIAFARLRMSNFSWRRNRKTAAVVTA